MAPLTAVTDLPTHPTLSRPFTSKALSELVKQCCSLMQKESAALWKVKPMLTKLIGDNTWVPCGTMIEPNDLDLFTDTASFIRRPTKPPTTTADANETNPPRDTGKENGDGGSHDPTQGDGPQGTEDGKGKDKETVDGQRQPETRADTNGEMENAASAVKGTAKTNQVNGNTRSEPGDSAEMNGETQRDGNPTKTEGSAGGDIDMAEARDPERVPEPGTQNGGSRAVSAGTESQDDLFIHPFFLAPRSAHPDRDLALPENEAEDLRRLLQLYVQKQEEVCRGTKKLYEGLLKADRYRRTVWQWSKAEAHCGPNRDMSDGEDWYDKEEWGLTEDLKKGEDEVEEDTTQTQKKTRNRK